MQRDQDARQNEQDPNDEIPDSLQFILWIDHKSFALLEDILSLFNLYGRTPGLLTLHCLAQGMRYLLQIPGLSPLQWSLSLLPLFVVVVKGLNI